MKEARHVLLVELVDISYLLVELVDISYYSTISYSRDYPE
jgi:hypothetical protein